MWVNKNINLGEIKENDKINLSFEYTGDLKKDLNNLTPCCGSCTTIRSIEPHKFYAVFDVGTIPEHLNTSSWEVEKCINAYMNDGSIVRLTFKAKIKRV